MMRTVKRGQVGSSFLTRENKRGIFKTTLFISFFCWVVLYLSLFTLLIFSALCVKYRVLKICTLRYCAHLCLRYRHLNMVLDLTHTHIHTHTHTPHTSHTQTLHAPHAHTPLTNIWIMYWALLSHTPTHVHLCMRYRHLNTRTHASHALTFE